MNWFDKFMIKMTLGDVIKDYGIFATEEYLSTHQELSLLKCKRSETEFYVIKAYNRSVSSALFGASYEYFKLGKESLIKLKNIICELE
jgi:hypothetical protein